MIELDDVGFAYQPGAPVLAGVTLALRPGLTLLLGPNGCGKSTLLKVAAGVERPDSGTVRVGGHDAWREEVAARRELAYVPEQPDLSPYASILEILHLVARLRDRPVADVARALETVGLRDEARRSVRELSMGQRRRAVLAAAFVGAPRVVLLDEPLEAMDRATRVAILGWVASLLAASATVVVATHDLEPFVALATRAVAVAAGGVAVVEPLPGDGALRLALLERLARGAPEG